MLRDGINKPYEYVLQENAAEEVPKVIKNSFEKMSASFPDSHKALKCFEKLYKMKDNIIFSTLVQLLGEVTLKSAKITRVRFAFFVIFDNVASSVEHCLGRNCG